MGRRSKPVPEYESDSVQPVAAICTLQARKRDYAIKQIRDAAIDLFAEKGFDETTIDDIAQAAGMSRRSFFRYFPSKNDLMAYGALAYGAALTDAIDRCPRTYSPAQVMKQAVLQMAQLSAMYPRTRTLLQITSKYPAARAAQLSRMGAVQKQVTDAFARRFPRKRNGKLAPRVLAGLTISIYDAVLHSWFDGGKQDMPAMANQVFTMLGELFCDKEQPTKGN